MTQVRRAMVRRSARLDLSDRLLGKREDRNTHLSVHPGIVRASAAPRHLAPARVIAACVRSARDEHHAHPTSISGHADSTPTRL